MGPLAFAQGADTWRLATDVEFDKQQKFIPGTQPGEVVASDYNPVIG